MEVVFWSIEDKLAENLPARLQPLCHQMDNSGGLVKAFEGAGSGGHALITFWKDWQNVTRFLGNVSLAMFGSPHHFEIVWQYPREETAVAETGHFFLLYDFYGEESAASDLLEHLRTGIAALRHESGFESGAIWIDRNNASHLVLAAHWGGSASPSREVVDKCLKVDADAVPVREKRLSVYKVRVVNPMANVI